MASVVNVHDVADKTSTQLLMRTPTVTNSLITYINDATKHRACLQLRIYIVRKLLLIADRFSVTSTPSYLDNISPAAAFPSRDYSAAGGQSPPAAHRRADV